MKPDFCQLDVQIIHDVKDIELIDATPETIDNVEVSYYSNVDFNMDFTLIAAEENEANKFELTIWNFDSNLKLKVNDYITFDFFWQSDPARNYGKQFCIIEDIKFVDGVDKKLTLKGSVSEQFAMKHILISDTNQMIYTLADFFVLVDPLGISQVASTIPNVTLETPFDEPIATMEKTVLEIGIEIVEKLTAQTELNIGWRIDNRTNIVFFDRDVIREYVDTEVAVIKREDTFALEKDSELSKKTTEEVIYKQFRKIEVHGVPTVKQQSIIDFDATLYIVEEIQHTITTNEGYNMKLFMYTFSSEPIDEEVVA